ncbi:MAG: hypothetical protein EA447_06600 [Nitrosopumilus sp.]|nr:MAG: hypothetical protein EA447_06600 [Nitrosopumilus sp.]
METPNLFKYVENQRKEISKISKRELGNIGRKILYGTVTLEDFKKHRRFLLKKRREFYRDQFKQRLENMAVRTKKD